MVGHCWKTHKKVSSIFRAQMMFGKKEGKLKPKLPNPRHLKNSPKSLCIKVSEINKQTSAASNKVNM